MKKQKLFLNIISIVITTTFLWNQCVWANDLSSNTLANQSNVRVVAPVALPAMDALGTVRRLMEDGILTMADLVGANSVRRGILPDGKGCLISEDPSGGRAYYIFYEGKRFYHRVTTSVDVKDKLGLLLLSLGIPIMSDPIPAEVGGKTLFERQIAITERHERYIESLLEIVYPEGMDLASVPATASSAPAVVYEAGTIQPQTPENITGELARYLGDVICFATRNGAMRQGRVKKPERGLAWVFAALLLLTLPACLHGRPSHQTRSPAELITAFERGDVSVDSLGGLLKKGDISREVRVTVIKKLGEQGGLPEVHPLIEQLEDRDYLVRKEAALGLENILNRNSEAAGIYTAKFGLGYREVLRAYSLIDYIYEGGDSTDTTYIQAWEQLVELGDSARPALKEALNDYGRYFRGCAAATLLRIGDRNPELEAHVAIGKAEWEKVLQLGYASVSPLICNLSDSSILEILPGFADGEGAGRLIGDLLKEHESHIRNTMGLLEVLGYRFSQEKPEGVPETVRVTVYRFRLVPIGMTVTYKITREAESEMYMWKPPLKKRTMERDEGREQDARDLLDFVKGQPKYVGNPEILGLRIVLNDPDMEPQLRYESADALFDLGHYDALYDAMRNSRDNEFRAYVAARLLDVENGKRELYVALFRKWLPDKSDIPLSMLKEYLYAYLYVGLVDWDEVRQLKDKAIPALLDGLRDNNRDIRGMCALLLLEILNTHPDGMRKVMDSEIGIGYMRILSAYEMVWARLWDEVEKLGGFAVPALEAAVNLNGEIPAAEVLARMGDERAFSFLKEQLNDEEGVDKAGRSLNNLGYELRDRIRREELIDPVQVPVRGIGIIWLGKPKSGNTPEQGVIIPPVPLMVQGKGKRGFHQYIRVGIASVVLSALLIVTPIALYNHSLAYAINIIINAPLYFGLIFIVFCLSSIVLGGMFIFIFDVLKTELYMWGLKRSDIDTQKSAAGQLAGIARSDGRLEESIVGELTKLLYSSDEAHARGAVYALGMIRNDRVAELLGVALKKYLGKGNISMASAIMEELKLFDIKQTYNIWIKVVVNAENDSSIRIKALEALGERREGLEPATNKRIDDILFALLQYEKNDVLRAKAAELLARRGTDTAVDELIRYLRRNPPDRDVLRGILASGEIQDARIIDALENIHANPGGVSYDSIVYGGRVPRLEIPIEFPNIEFPTGSRRKESQYSREIREGKEEIVFKLGMNHDGKIGEEKEVGNLERLAGILGVELDVVIQEVKKRLQSELDELKGEEGAGIFGAVKEIWLVDNLGGLHSRVRGEKGLSVLHDGTVLIDIDAFRQSYVLRDVVKHELWHSILELVESNIGVQEVSAIYKNLEDFVALPADRKTDLIEFLNLDHSQNGLDSQDYARLLQYIVDNEVTGDALIAMALGYVLKTGRYSDLRGSLEGIIDQDIRDAVERLNLAQGIYAGLIEATRGKQVVETVKDAERKSRAVMKAKMVISLLSTMDTGFVQDLLDSGRFIRLDMDELIKPENKYIMQWLEKLLRDRKAKSPFILFSRSGNTTVDNLLKDYEGLGADKFRIDDEVGSEIPRNNIGTLYDMAGKQPSAEEQKRGLSIPHMYSATGIYLAAQVVMADGNIRTISDPLVRSTLEAFYKAIFGDEFSEEKQWWIDLFDGKKWPPAQRVTAILDDLRKAIVQLEKAA